MSRRAVSQKLTDVSEVLTAHIIRAVNFYETTRCNSQKTLIFRNIGSYIYSCPRYVGAHMGTAE
jgi:hypothetical protein